MGEDGYHTFVVKLFKVVDLVLVLVLTVVAGAQLDSHMSVNVPH